MPVSSRTASAVASVRRVLVALDGSDCALRALSAAVDRSREMPGTLLHLLTVQCLSGALDESGAWRQRQRAQRIATLRTDWVLRQAEQRIPAAGLHYAKEVLQGEPATLIVQRAGQLRCDVIFIGAHGTGSVQDADIGSVAAQVCALSNLPVRVVK